MRNQQEMTEADPAFEEIYELFMAVIASLDLAMQLLPPDQQSGEEYLRLSRAKKAAVSGAALAKSQISS